MLKYTHGDVKIKGINLHYYRTGGKKPPFILLHGASDNGLCWAPVAELLAKQYDVIMPDAQGHGLSDRIDRDFNEENHAHQVAGLVQELGISKPIIMGHSMGAGVTSVVAAKYPDLPRAIILEDIAWDGYKLLQTKQNSEVSRTLIERVSRTREELINECRQANPRWSEAEIIPWAEAKKQFDPTILSVVTMGGTSYTQVVPFIKCPVFVIISDGGIGSPEGVERAKKLYRSDQPFRWVQIKGAGHNIRREQFKAFCEALFDFLQILPK